MATTTRFRKELAPCGRVTEGDHYRDQDDDGLIIDRMSYACGCRSTRHEYHDGSISRRVIRHDGNVILNERSAEHGA